MEWWQLDTARVFQMVQAVFFGSMHAKRVLSIASGTVGTMHAATLGVTAVGRALAQVQGLESKHAVKQIDRLLSNEGIDVWKAFVSWVPFVVGSREEIVVALDWTDFDQDGHMTLAAHVVTSHGRATPLMWKTVRKSRLRGHRNGYEDELLAHLRAVVPTGVKVTVLADRGFGDANLYGFHEQLGFDHVIRFRGNVKLTDAQGECRPAKEWLLPSGRARILRNVTVTGQKKPVAAVVCVWAKGMKEPWFLACGAGSGNGTAAQVVKLYGRRFTIEESFRDLKDIRYGMGLSTARISSPLRRDRLLLLRALSTVLLTLLGGAGESLGFDRLLKVNTVKHRTHSLLFQGTYYYGALAAMEETKRQRLMTAFGRLLCELPVFNQVFGLL